MKVVEPTSNEEHGHTAVTRNGEIAKALPEEAVGKSKHADLNRGPTKEVRITGTSPGDEAQPTLHMVSHRKPCFLEPEDAKG